MCLISLLTELQTIPKRLLVPTSERGLFPISVALSDHRMEPCGWLAPSAAELHVAASISHLLPLSPGAPMRLCLGGFGGPWEFLGRPGNSDKTLSSHTCSFAGFGSPCWPVC